MIEIFDYDGEGFRAIHSFEGWKLGLINYSERFSAKREFERHLKTDEAFVLLEGNAKLYTDVQEVAMEKGKIYNVPACVWHHIVLSEDAKVLVIENSDTSKENTEKMLVLEEKSNADK